MLTIYRSNRVEALADGLEKLLRTPLSDALQSEVIVVQSMGMRRWLSFEIARRFGVAMNCEFPFFADFSQQIFRETLGGEPAGRDFSREVLPWRVLGALEAEWSRPALEPVRRYVGEDDASELKRFQIAEQIATVLDRYMGHDPALLLKWEAGADGDWQAHLWRALSREGGGAHPPGLLARLQEKVGAGELRTDGLPERVSVFGIASLPSFYLQTIRVVAEVVPVHLFLFEPTDQYWGDVKSRREQGRFLRKHARAGQTAEDLHLETGNELLASWGKAGRLFAEQVQELEPHGFEEDFPEPDGGTMLGRLQRDIFRLRGAGEEEDEDEDECDAASLIGDRTVQIHCCHSPMRELEVLYDALLDLFARHRDLTPKDILVTMPDVQKYAPYIEAVFGTAERDDMAIPFTIADRSAASGSAVARTFLKILSLPGKRMTAPEVFEIIEAAPVRERFGIAEPELELVRAGIERNGIRWGIDGAHREELGLPAFEQNSWREGLDRWLLGTALMDTEPRLYEGLLPDFEAEGNLALLAGNFADFAEALFEVLPALATARPLRAWSQDLRRLLDRFFVEETGEDVLAVHKALAALSDMARWHEGAVSFAAIRAHLQGVLGQTDSGGGFLAGQVTFCSLKPMRSIPFRVICTLGLNDGAFPRKETPIAFDLLSPTNGGQGRSRREEDRQLFLESLLSAREVFYLSYSGLSAKDNSEAPPATVVSELLDYLEALAPRDESGDEEKPYARFVVRHPLQPFSPKYFAASEGPLFSYSGENWLASQPAVRTPGGTWVDAPLPALEPEWRQVELRRLIEFFRHPARYFLRHRLRIELPAAEGTPEDCEPMALDGLESWQVLTELTNAALAGRDLQNAAALARASGRLSAGHFGDYALAGARAKAAAAAEQVAALAMGNPVEPLPVRLAFGEWELAGTIDNLYEGGRVHVSGADISPKDRLSAWITHLALCAVAPEKALETALLDSKETVRFQPAAQAAATLRDLLEIYAQGLATPLPFFPKTAYEFARRKLDPGKTRTDPLTAARDRFDRSERGDAHTVFCFGQVADPLDATFQEIALRVLTPMLKP